MSKQIIQNRIEHLKSLNKKRRERIKKIQDGKYYTINLLNFIREQLMDIDMAEKEISQLEPRVAEYA